MSVGNDNCTLNLNARNRGTLSVFQKDKPRRLDGFYLEANWIGFPMMLSENVTAIKLEISNFR